MKIIVFIFIVLVSFSAKGQESADNYFKESAKMYVLGNNAGALQIVNEGLDTYPSDKKLNELKKKLEEKKDNNKDKDKKDDKKEEDKKDQDKKDGDKDKKDDKKDGGKDKKNEKPEGDGKPKPMPGGISKQRLENLLDAVNNEEKKIQDKVNGQKVKGKPVQTEKDW